MHLRDYQQRGAHWLRAHRKGILADDVGLGKTVQALAALEYPALIVAPSHLVWQWYDAACSQLPTCTVSLPEGSIPQRMSELAVPADVSIVSYETFRSPLFYAPYPYHTLVLEEAHRVRNPKSDQSKAAASLAKTTDNVYLLTASPYYKGTQDVWNLLRIVDAHNCASYWDFLRRWYSVNWAHPYTPKIYGIKPKLRAEWNMYISQYMLQRTYEQVGRELPPLIEEIVPLQLPTALRTTYDQVRKEYRLEELPLEAAATVIVTLRALTMNHTKLDAIASILDSLPSGEPALIFVWYRDSAHKLSARLKAPHVVLTGETTPKERTLLLDKARTNGYHVIATQASLSEGANLQYMRFVVFAEESYVPEEHRQALSRVRRDRNEEGSSSSTPVVAYYVRTRRTIDETIARARQRGAKSIRDVVRSI